ncbi:MAG: fibrobacter succinogenes major paralogous domain-containing protein [Candidatus Marinimicrobia bacterium]|nr:fibrobacter succinogenes major paralogous domain-containing protein [Candidatus Neomarinimicrobiota bacterium]
MEDIIPDEFQLWAADSNEDDSINVLDIVGVVQCIITFCWDNGEDTCIDIDGNVYNTVVIGDQEWMAENLKVTHYRNGDEIPTGYSDEEWSQLDDTETGVFAIYDDDPANEDTYGNLYNWFAVDDTRDICPEGWHVPTDAEWTELTDYLGGEDVAGGKMKSTGTVENGDGLWYDPNAGATNESGFTALPAGSRTGSGSYIIMGYSCIFWSSTENNSNNAWTRFLYHNISFVSPNEFNKLLGFSVRCVGGAD